MTAYTRRLTDSERWAWVRHPGVRTDLIAETAARVQSYLADNDLEECAVLIVDADGTVVEAWGAELQRECDHGELGQCESCQADWTHEAAVDAAVDARRDA